MKNDIEVATELMSQVTDIDNYILILDQNLSHIETADIWIEKGRKVIESFFDSKNDYKDTTQDAKSKIH